MIPYLKNLFWDPDPFEYDPWNFLFNQAGHIGIFYGLAHFWRWVLSDIDFYAPLTPAIVGIFIAMIIAVLWESLQVFKAGAYIYDALEDAAYMFSGALLLIWWPPLVIVLPLFLAYGAARRFGI